MRALEPTFGGINLEDIKAPECFRIEEELKAAMTIPVFHDDQHGAAIISGAALLNALTIVGKKIDEVKVVFSGAGAAGIACAKFNLGGVARKPMADLAKRSCAASFTRRNASRPASSSRRGPKRRS